MEASLQKISAHSKALLADPSLNALARSLATEIDATSEHNIARIMESKAPTESGEVGYMNFPDYGELGEMIGNIRLLDSLTGDPAPSKHMKAVTW
jgi:hypothetical protein